MYDYDNYDYYFYYYSKFMYDVQYIYKINNYKDTYSVNYILL